MAEEHHRSDVDIKPNGIPVPVAIIRVQNKCGPPVVVSAPVSAPASAAVSVPLSAPVSATESDEEIEPEFVRRQHGNKTLDERVAAYKVFKRFLAEEEKYLSKDLYETARYERVTRSRTCIIKKSKECYNNYALTRRRKPKPVDVPVVEEPAEEPAADPLLIDFDKIKEEQEKLLQNGQKIIAYNIFQRYLCEEYPRSRSINKAAEDVGVTRAVMSNLIEEIENRTTQSVKVDEPVEQKDEEKPVDASDKMAAYKFFQDTLSKHELPRSKCIRWAALKLKISLTKMYNIIKYVEGPKKRPSQQPELAPSAPTKVRNRRKNCNARDRAMIRSVMFRLYKNGVVPTVDNVAKTLDDDGYVPAMCRATLNIHMKKCWV